MSEMTDFDICKKIAEIEGVKFRVRNEMLEAHPWTVATGFSCAHMGKEYDPLNWSITGPLMVKYKVSFWDRENGYYAAKVREFGNNPICDKNPQRAICLAIIAKHEH